MLVDSHCHLDMLDLSAYDGKLDGAIAAAKKMDVRYFLCAGIDLDESQHIIDIAEKYPEVRTSVGQHPTEHVKAENISAEDIIRIAKNPLVVAIGETGLDHYRHVGAISSDEKERQKNFFCAHIYAAKKLQKPLIIHSRAAGKETLRILAAEKASEIGGVMHCFAYDWPIAEKAMELGFYIGITGVVTFKNAHSLQEIVTKLPLERILLETDCPFLAPEPYRGKPNEPAYLFYIAERVAKLKKVSYQTVAEKTSENFFNLFKTLQNIK